MGSPRTLLLGLCVAVGCDTDGMIHESAAAGYRQQSVTYGRVRPSYHPELITRFSDAFGRGTVVDLGAGTGIFTRQLLTRGISPIAIEPVAEMRATFATHAAGVEAISGTAEATGLPADSVDTVAVAQAFHWFDYPRALAEIRRILRPGGHLVCVWNVRDESVDWVQAYTEVIDRYAGDTPRHRTMQWRKAIDAEPAFHNVDDWSIDNPKPTNQESIADRALSTSFIAALAPETQQSVLTEINAVTQPLGPKFDFPYRSELQAWQHRQ